MVQLDWMPDRIGHELVLDALIEEVIGGDVELRIDFITKVLIKAIVGQVRIIVVELL